MSCVPLPRLTPAITRQSPKTLRQKRNHRQHKSSRQDYYRRLLERLRRRMGSDDVALRRDLRMFDVAYAPYLLCRFPRETDTLASWQWWLELDWHARETVLRLSRLARRP